MCTIGVWKDAKTPCQKISIVDDDSTPNYYLADIRSLINDPNFLVASLWPSFAKCQLMFCPNTHYQYLFNFSFNCLKVPCIWSSCTASFFVRLNPKAMQTFQNETHDFNIFSYVMASPIIIRLNMSSPLLRQTSERWTTNVIILCSTYHFKFSSPDKFWRLPG